MALDELSDLQLGIMIYGGCAIIEALSEPFAIKYIIQMDFKVRVIAEVIIEYNHNILGSGISAQIELDLSIDSILRNGFNGTNT